MLDRAFPDAGIPALRDVHLVLFMTEGMSLAAWDQIGMFEREVAIYRRLRPHLRAITLVSYGGKRDLAYRDRLPGIRIVCNRGLPEKRYRHWLATRLPGCWHSPVLVKTNQTAGSDLARSAAVKAGARFIARCGYWLSDFAAQEHGHGAEQAETARRLEERSYPAADRCIVTTAAMARALRDLGVEDGRIDIVPNYVDTDLFMPQPEPSSSPGIRISFVGRLVPQKNPDLLIRAAQAAGMGADIVGDGPLMADLRTLAGSQPVTFHGNLPHGRLPAIIQDSFCFLFPSNYEGHPKALLEAMACGVPVIASRRPGLQEVIRDGETGLLVEPALEDILAAIARLRTEPGLAARLGTAARAYICDQLSLDSTVHRELSVYARTLTIPPRACSPGHKDADNAG